MNTYARMRLAKNSFCFNFWAYLCFLMECVWVEHKRLLKLFGLLDFSPVLGLLSGLTTIRDHEDHITVQ
jgi:hypothetical protein